MVGVMRSWDIYSDVGLSLRFGPASQDRTGEDRTAQVKRHNCGLMGRIMRKQLYMAIMITLSVS